MCALHCAQLLHTILHKTDPILFPPDSVGSSKQNLANFITHHQLHFNSYFPGEPGSAGSLSVFFLRKRPSGNKNHKFLRADVFLSPQQCQVTIHLRMQCVSKNATAKVHKKTAQIRTMWQLGLLVACWSHLNQQLLYAGPRLVLG